MCVLHPSMAAGALGKRAVERCRLAHAAAFAERLRMRTAARAPLSPRTACSLLPSLRFELADEGIGKFWTNFFFVLAFASAGAAALSQWRCEEALRRRDPYRFPPPPFYVLKQGYQQWRVRAKVSPVRDRF